MEPRYLGMNGRIDALAAAWLFAHDHLFFADGDVTWDGSHHSINALQSNVGLETEAPIFWSNRQVLAQGAADLVLWLEKDEELIVPRDQISPGLYSAIGEGDLTGLTLFNLQACGRAFSFLNGSNVTAYGSLVGMESSSEDESNWESVQDVLQMAGMDELLAIPAAKSAARVVVFDTRLANGIPNFFSLVTKMYEDMLDYNEIDLPYILIFMSTVNFDADPFLGDVGDPVPGAASAPIHIETNVAEWQTSRDSEEDAGCAVEDAAAEDGNEDEGADEEASEREAVTAMLRLLVLAAELSGKSLFPKELLDELERAENGDESVDLEGLAERLSACVLDAQVDDSSNASFDGGAAVDGQCGLSQESTSLCRADVAQAAYREEGVAEESELSFSIEDLFAEPDYTMKMHLSLTATRGDAIEVDAFLREMRDAYDKGCPYPERFAFLGEHDCSGLFPFEVGRLFELAAEEIPYEGMPLAIAIMGAVVKEFPQVGIAGKMYNKRPHLGVRLLWEISSPPGDEGCVVESWRGEEGPGDTDVPDPVVLEEGASAGDPLGQVLSSAQNPPKSEPAVYDSEQLDSRYKCEAQAAQREAEEKEARSSELAAKWETANEYFHVPGQADPVAFAISGGHALVLNAYGRCAAVGDDSSGQCDVSEWGSCVAVAAGDWHSVALREEGTCVAAGFSEDGRCDVSGWRHVVDVAAGDSFTVALLADGTCCAAGGDEGVCKGVAAWSEVDAIEAGSCHVVGLKANGTCVAAGDNNSGQCDVSYWCNIVAIAAGSRHTVAVKRDGSCIATGQNGDGQCDVLSWHDVVSVSAGHRHTVGLCADGTCIAVGSNKRGQCDVSRWQGVVAVAAGGNLTVALLSDGTCVSAGAPGLLQEAIAKWTPFCTDALLAERTKMLVRLSGSRAEHAELLREERRMAEKRAEQIKKEKEAEAAKAAEQERRRRMAAGKCQHCGGSFKGLFSKKCEICKKPKDY